METTRPKIPEDNLKMVLEPLKDAPIISKMTDRQLKLSWKPSVYHAPRDPVTYRVEMKDEPDGQWKPLRTGEKISAISVREFNFRCEFLGVMSCAMEVRNLQPHEDYSFRVCVESRYGISDPSPSATTSRRILAPRPSPERFHLEPGTEFNPEISPYFPADFDLDRPPHDKYTAAPRLVCFEKTTKN